MAGILLKELVYSYMFVTQNFIIDSSVFIIFTFYKLLKLFSEFSLEQEQKRIRVLLLKFISKGVIIRKMLPYLPNVFWK